MTRESDNQIQLSHSIQHKPAIRLRKLSKKDRLGKIGEQVTYSPLRKAAKELGLTAVWSGKKAYYESTNNDGKHEPDFKDYYGKKLLKTYENKNWRNGFYYGCETAHSEVISRIVDSYAFESGLTISFLDCFSQPAQELIETYCNDSIIETGKLIGSKDFRNRELFLNLYNQFKADLTATLNRLKNYPQHIQQLLDKVLEPFKPKPSDFSMYQIKQSIANSVDNTVTVTNQLQQTHNTQNSNLIAVQQDNTDKEDFVWRNGVKIPIAGIEHLNG